MNNLIEVKKELIAEIASLPAITYYLEVKRQVERQGDIKKLTREIKRTQQQLVNAQQASKFEQAKLLKEVLAEKNNLLEDIPMYQEFIAASSEAQEVLDNVSELINESLTLDI